MMHSEDKFVTIHIGRSTWQGLKSEIKTNSGNPERIWAFPWYGKEGYQGQWDYFDTSPHYGAMVAEYVRADLYDDAQSEITRLTAELERCKANPTTRDLDMTTQINAEDFYDYVAAEKEGWFISYAPGNLDETIWRLERRDANPVFLGGDPEAHIHVVKRALEGSKLHQDALDFLRTYEPREYEIVLRHATATERDQSHAQAVTATDLVAVNECVEMVDELYDSVLASKARQELDVLTPTLAQAAAAALEMRKRATVTYAMYSGVDLTKRLRTLPIPTDAQKALDQMLAQAREDAIREAAALCAPKKAKVTRGNRFTPSVTNPQSAAAQAARKQCQDSILALLNEGG